MFAHSENYAGIFIPVTEISEVCKTKISSAWRMLFLLHEKAGFP